MKIVACDPGESFGYCVGEDNLLREAGTVELWDFVHALGDVLLPAALPQTSSDAALLKRLQGVEHVVIEDWALYPWAMQNGALDFDKCRTARAIGAIEYICRVSGTPYTLQGASIKDTAQAAGVEDLYLTPLHENRHANDSIQHLVVFNLKRGNPPVRWEKAAVGA